MADFIYLLNLYRKTLESDLKKGGGIIGLHRKATIMKEIRIFLKMKTLKFFLASIHTHTNTRIIGVSNSESLMKQFWCQTTAPTNLNCRSSLYKKKVPCTI